MLPTTQEIAGKAKIAEDDAAFRDLNASLMAGFLKEIPLEQRLRGLGSRHVQPAMCYQASRSVRSPTRNSSVLYPSKSGFPV